VNAASGERRDGRGEKLGECSIAAMRRLLALLAGGLGIGALLRRRRRAPALPLPADELRAALAEARARPQEPAAAPASAPAPEAPPAAPQPPAAAETPGDVASRRADVHERARRAIDELGA
jgi:hypothetical protein